MLEDWLFGARVRSVAHDKAVEYYSRLNRFLGIPAIMVTAMVGTTIFATLSEAPTKPVLVAVGSLSIMAAVLTSLQTFLGYSALAEKHKTAADKFSDIRREIEAILAGSTAKKTMNNAISVIKEKWGVVQTNSPSIPTRIEQSALSYMRKKLNRPETAGFAIRPVFEESKSDNSPKSNES